MIIYPKSESGGFTVDELRQGTHWLHTDVECTACGKVQALAMAGSTDNGSCVACGGRTS
jgi:hypothetical protein